VSECRVVCGAGAGLAQAMPPRSKGNSDHVSRLWPANRRAAGAPSPRFRLPATNSVDRVAACEKRSAGFHPKHQDHDGCCVAERGRRVPLRQGQNVRRESLADVAVNEHRWVDHGYPIEDCKRHTQGCLLLAEAFQQFGGPGAIRTRDTRFRRAVLYPLSYGAIWSRVPVGS
jgi:hypothetical protein